MGRHVAGQPGSRHAQGERGRSLRMPCVAGIGAEKDALQMRCLGKTGEVVMADPKDQTVKGSVAGVGDVWFAAKAVRPIDWHAFAAGDLDDLDLGFLQGMLDVEAWAFSRACWTWRRARQPSSRRPASIK